MKVHFIKIAEHKRYMFITTNLDGAKCLFKATQETTFKELLRFISLKLRLQNLILREGHLDEPMR